MSGFGWLPGRSPNRRVITRRRGSALLSSPPVLGGGFEADGRCGLSAAGFFSGLLRGRTRGVPPAGRLSPGVRVPTGRRGLLVGGGSRRAPGVLASRWPLDRGAVLGRVPRVAVGRLGWRCCGGGVAAARHRVGTCGCPWCVWPVFSGGPGAASAAARRCVLTCGCPQCAWPVFSGGPGAASAAARRCVPTCGCPQCAWPTYSGGPGAACRRRRPCRHVPTRPVPGPGRRPVPPGPRLRPSPPAARPGSRRNGGWNVPGSGSSGASLVCRSRGGGARSGPTLGSV
jgi:hypothetical protein